MLQQTKLDLGLYDDLSDLTIKDCRNYLSKLDVISTGSRVAELRSELKESHLEGKAMLHANGGRLLKAKRYALFKQFKRLGDCRKFNIRRLRSYAKRLGIENAGNLKKNCLIKSLLDIETSFLSN